MSSKEKPLPEPTSRAFGGRAPEEQSLLSDRMAAAIAEGRLEEFLKEELPDSEQARSLAMMMLGMTGMLPSAAAMPQPPKQEKEERPDLSAGGTTADILQAVQGGDVKGLMDLLRQEHVKRTGKAEPEPSERAPSPTTDDRPAIDREIVDALLKMASDNSVSLDWLIFRAIKMYVEEYQKTGKL